METIRMVYLNITWIKKGQDVLVVLGFLKVLGLSHKLDTYQEFCVTQEKQKFPVFESKIVDLLWGNEFWSSRSVDPSGPWWENRAGPWQRCGHTPPSCCCSASRWRRQGWCAVAVGAEWVDVIGGYLHGCFQGPPIPKQLPSAKVLWLKLSGYWDTCAPKQVKYGFFKKALGHENPHTPNCSSHFDDTQVRPMTWHLCWPTFLHLQNKHFLHFPMEFFLCTLVSTI